MKLNRTFLLMPLLALGACSVIPDSPAAQDALKGVQVAITTYADVYQPAVITYGRLPVCPTATICHDQSLLTKMKAADKAVTASIVAAQSVLEGTVTDAGQITAALQAIQSAETTIASSGAMKAN